MSDRMWISAAILAAASAATGAKAEGEAALASRSKIEQARQELRRRLTDAEINGAVEIKDDELKSSSSAPVTITGAPALRAELRENAEARRCLSFEDLQAASDQNGADPITAIEALRRRLQERVIQDRDDIEVAVSVAYLVSGLDVEARAFASKAPRDDAREVIALADIASGIRPTVELAPGNCGPLRRFIVAATRLSAGDGTEVDTRSLSDLRHFPEVLRQAIAESLTPFALDRGDEAIIDLLHRTLGDGSAASPLLASYDASRSLDDASVEMALRRISLEAGPLQAHAAVRLAEADRVETVEIKAAAKHAVGGAKRRLDEIVAKRLISLEDFVEAARTIEAIDASDPDMARELSSSLATALNENWSATPDDGRMKVLASLIEAPSIMAPLLDDEVAHATSSWLSDFGFEEMAAEILHVRQRASEVAAREVSRGASHRAAPTFESDGPIKAAAAGSAAILSEVEFGELSDKLAHASVVPTSAAITDAITKLSAEISRVQELVSQ